VDNGLREYIEKNSFKKDVMESDFELLMGAIAGLEEKNGKLEKQLQRNESYFSCICEALDIDHKSSLTEMLIAITKLKPNKGR